MPNRPRSRCTNPACRRLHDSTGLCPGCRRAGDSRRYARRGTTTERGLGWDHQQAAAQVLQDATHCALCGLPPRPDDPLQAGHVDPRERGGSNDPANYQPEHRSCNSRKISPGRQVTLVTGPPCAGKSTYVRAHAQPGDLVLDLDEIARQLGSTRHWMHDDAVMRRAEQEMRRRITALAGGGAVRAWVIRCVPAGQARAALARLLRADRVLVLLPPHHELTARALERPDRMATVTAITQWLDAYSPADPDAMITG
jgi:hypothetical protein